MCCSINIDDLSNDTKETKRVNIPLKKEENKKRWEKMAKLYEEIVVAITMVLLVSIIPMAAPQEQPSWECWGTLRACHSNAGTAEEFMQTCCPFIVEEMITTDRECFCLIKPQLPTNPTFAEELSGLLSLCSAPSVDSICPDSTSGPSPSGTPITPTPSATTPSTDVAPTPPSAQPPSSPSPTSDDVTPTPSAVTPTPSASPPSSTPSAPPPDSTTPSIDETPITPPPVEDDSPVLAPPPTLTPPAADDSEDQQNAANKMGLTGLLSSGLLISFTFVLFN